MVHRLTSSHGVILIIDSDNVGYLQCGGEREEWGRVEEGMGEGRGMVGIQLARMGSTNSCICYSPTYPAI